MLLHYFIYFLALFGLVIIIAVPYAMLEKKRKQRELEKVFAGRQVLSERDFYERYFAEKGVPYFVVLNVRQILEEEHDVDLSQLSAADDFSKNLSFLQEYDSLDAVEVLVRIEEEFEIEITDEEAENVRTVENLIELVWTKIREKEF